MANLKTTYMGIPLKNPLIVGASHLTANLDQIKILEEAGAAAIVTKSLFEEQIQLERFKMDDERETYYYRHPEMITVGSQQEHAGPKEHLYWVERTKKEIQIPVIASLNAVEKETWIDYARQLAATGIDGLELNFYASPKAFEHSALDIEKEQIDIVRSVLNVVDVPVSLKLSPFYTNPLNFIQLMDEAGVQAFVLFNRLFQPEIDIHQQKHVFPFYLSHPKDHRLPLRFAGLLYDSIQADICSSTGIYQGEDAIRMMLAGATCFQVVSALIKQQTDPIGNILKTLTTWMDENNYADLDAYRGMLSKAKMKDPWTYTRAQYINWIMHPDKLLRRNKIP